VAIELEMSSGEVINYIKNNVLEFDKVSLAYNRVSAEGDFLGSEESFDNGKESYTILIALDGEIISDVVEVDLKEYEDDIIEFTHYPKDDSKKSVYIEVL
ncbi:MAG: DUF2097 domain-containing protein, partial [archaeon]|nr:DUF2097 domain-containing protein [archaeon]